ncbi:MAG: MarR family transcriptional regulator [Actinomycetota bacterium]|nr:MarR family transcriptional regulator [Actinomycetota bacterium]
MRYANDVSLAGTALDVRSDAALARTLRNSMARLSRRMRFERASTDLSLNQLTVLGTLDRRGPLTIGELAAAEKVQPPSMTRTVTCLADLGLVRREAHPSDRRQVVVHLSEAARQVLAEDSKRKDAWLARRLRELTPDERRLLRQVAPILERLAHA